MKIGQKITMISVHSSGQPSRKMIICEMIRNPTGERFMLSTQRSISPWPPCSAKTPEKSAEPTNSQQTIAVVFAVRKRDSLMFCQSSREVPQIHEHRHKSPDKCGAERSGHEQRHEAPASPAKDHADNRSHEAPPPAAARDIWP